MAAGDVSWKWATSLSTIAIDPQNVASSGGFTAGVESDVIDCTGLVDMLILGIWTCGTTPTLGTQCNVYVFPVHVDSGTPQYQDVFDGTKSAETLTSAGVGRGFLELARAIDIDSTTSDRAYPVSFRVAQLFNFVMPPKIGLFISHNSGVTSNTTGSNHVWKYQGAYMNIAQS